MPLGIAEYPTTPSAFASASVACYAQDLQTRDYFDSDAIRMHINEVSVGTTKYPLRRQVSAIFVSVSGEFVVDGFSPDFIGHGATREESLRDWSNTIHASFQELIFKRPFELTDEDRRKWSVLSDCIDVTVYKNQTPTIVRAFGRVEKARPYPQTLRWENGSVEPIKLSQVNSPDFVTYKSGQPFEALVERDPITFELLRIRYIERKPDPRRVVAEFEDSDILNGVGSASVLEEVDWH